MSKKIVEAKMLRTMAYNGAIKWVDQMITAHERVISSLKERRARLVTLSSEKEEGAETGTNLVSWSVNDVTGISANLRLDMAANHSAAIALAEANLSKAEDR